MRRVFCIFLVMFLLIPAVSAGERPKFVALTFDDGPSGRYTTALLDGLESREVSATFFLCGYRLETYGQLAEKIRSHGHEIGLHGYSHDPMAAMSPDTLTTELRQTRALLPRDTLVNLLRTPGGQHTDTIRRCARQENLALIHWSVDPKDWATDDAAAITESVLSRIQDGDIVLLHDLSDSSVDAALAIVDKLLEEDFEFVTVSELARIRRTELIPGREYKSFYPE